MPFDGLSPIVCGVLGYVSIILYDLNNVTRDKKRALTQYTTTTVCSRSTPSAPV